MSAPVWHSMSAKAYRSYRKRAKEAKSMYDAALRSKYKPNSKTAEIIGLVSASFSHITTDSVPGTLTVTTLDTTSRADSAQILLTNSTGVSRVIIAAWLRGKPVTRFSGAGRGMLSGGSAAAQTAGYRNQFLGGFLHDKFVDYEAQARDGDITFETGNNFVVTSDQTNRLADYYWKLNKTKKHIYTLNLVGFQTWYEPGEWYTLQIGGAGEEEYIDSTVECFDVRCSLQAGGAGYTSVSFREVEESWKFDSNETARKIASGGFNRRPSQSVVTVAAQYYSGYADYYCDGTNDQEEINSAISFVSQSGGGLVGLTKGTFNIATSITPISNVSIGGEHDGTILNAAATSVKCIYWSCALTAVENLSISNVGFNRTVDCLDYLYIYPANSVVVSDNTVIKPMVRGIALYGNSNAIINNYIDGESATAYCAAIAIGSDAATAITNIVSNNRIRNIIGNGAATYGIIATNPSYDGGVNINNNTIENLQSNSAHIVYGIYVDANAISVTSNSVKNLKNNYSSSSANVRGIYLAVNSTGVILHNNQTQNNGDATGYANINNCNFEDAGTDTQWAG